MPTRVASFRIHATAHADFPGLRKTLILVHGVHGATFEPERIRVTFDPDQTDLDRVRGVIAEQGYAPELEGG